MIKKRFRDPIFWALSIIAAVFLVFFARAWGHGTAMGWDSFGYYFYLPMLFIEHTIQLGSLEYPMSIFEQYAPSSSLYQFTHLKEGGHIIRYPAGLAVLFLPFFLVGHLAALLLQNHPVDGFSAPYELSMRVGVLFYHFGAFVLIAQLLRRYYATKVVAITLVLLFFATNALLYLLSSGLAANGALLFLNALLLLLLDNYYRKPSLALALGSGLVLGLMALSRPTEIMAFIVVLLWPAWQSGLHVKQLIPLWKAIPIKHFLGFGVVIALVGSVQLLYWKIASGAWIINSYGNPGEGLDFLSPHLWQYLFSFRKGWFLYTPFMLPVIFALYWLWMRRKRKELLPAAVYTLVFVYIAASWTNWWYGGAFAQRSVIQLYALLSLPLAMLVRAIFRKGMGPYAMAFGVFSICCIALNIWQSHQYLQGVRLAESETAKYYFSSFWDSSPDWDKIALLGDVDRHGVHVDTLTRIPTGYRLHASIDLVATLRDQLQEGYDPELEGKEFSHLFRKAYKELCPDDHCWFEFEVGLDREPPAGLTMVTTMGRREGNYGYKAYEAAHRVSNIDTLAGVWYSTCYYLSPHIRNGRDDLDIYLWNRERLPVRVVSKRLNVYTKE